MNTGFTSLPTVLGSCIISEWIELKDLVRLDYACNNHSIRSSFLSYCQSGTLLAETIKLRSINQIQWFINRELKFLIMSTSLLQFQKGIYNSLNELLVKIGGDIEEIHICPHSSLTPAQIVRFNNIIAQNCLNLQELNVSGNIKDKDISALLTLQDLEELEFTECKITNKSLFSIVDICTTLTSLRLINIDICDAGLTALAGKCPELMELQVIDYKNSSVKGVLALIKTTPKLKDLTVNVADLTNKDLTTIAQHCPKLQTFGADARFITDAAIKTLFSHCTQLRIVQFLHCLNISTGFSFFRNLEELRFYNCPTLTDAMVATIVKNNPLLALIRASCCVQLTSKAVVSILHGCPQLDSITVTNTRATAFDFSGTAPTSEMTSLMSTLIQEHYPKITEADINIV